MANKLYLINRTDFGYLLERALNNTYGTGVTVHYSDDDEVIFTCPSICDKVLRIWKCQEYYDGDQYFDELYCSYSDGWTSGTSLVNEIQFSGNNRTSSARTGKMYITEAAIVLGENFIFASFECGRDQMALMGKLTNGQYLCMGFNCETGYSDKTHGFLTDGTVGEVLIPTITEPFRDGTTLVLLPVIFLLDGVSIIKNQDGTFATIVGLYNLPNMYYSYMYQDYSNSYSSNFFVSQCRYFYTYKGIRMLDTPLFCEVEIGS